MRLSPLLRKTVYSLPPLLFLTEFLFQFVVSRGTGYIKKIVKVGDVIIRKREVFEEERVDMGTNAL